MLLVSVLVLASVAAGIAEELANLRGPAVEELHKTKIHSSQDGKVREQEKWLDHYLNKISKQSGINAQQEMVPGTGSLPGGGQQALDYYGGNPGLSYEGFVITRKYTDEKCTGPGTTTVKLYCTWSYYVIL
jgi:hypothetical protein